MRLKGPEIKKRPTTHSKALVWGNRLVFALALWAIACVSALPTSNEMLASIGAFERGPWAIFLQALTHDAVFYIGLLTILAGVAKELWLRKQIRLRFRINMVMLVVGAGLFISFIFANHLFIHFSMTPV